MTITTQSNETSSSVPPPTASEWREALLSVVDTIATSVIPSPRNPEDVLS